jgi:hypothetical protein
VPSSLEKAKRVLAESEMLPVGTFKEIGDHPYFPPRAFLNEFLALSRDPCDQDGLMGKWQPFTLSPDDYCELLAWWVAKHPGAVETSLDAKCWNEWADVVFTLWETRGIPRAHESIADPGAALDGGG